jgi:hypothetical protein
MYNYKLKSGFLIVTCIFDNAVQNIWTNSRKFAPNKGFDLVGGPRELNPLGSRFTLVQPGRFFQKPTHRKFEKRAVQP